MLKSLSHRTSFIDLRALYQLFHFLFLLYSVFEEKVEQDSLEVLALVHDCTSACYLVMFSLSNFSHLLVD